MLFCKKLWTFQNAKGFVSESSPYTLYKLKGVLQMTVEEAMAFFRIRFPQVYYSPFPLA